MKTLKTLIAGLFVCAIGSAGNAQTVMKVTGSTAFRAATTTAIKNLYIADPGNGSSPVKIGFIQNAAGNATLTSSSAAIFEGVLNGSYTVIKTHWSGSEGGLQTVAAQVNVTFLPADSSYSSNSSGNGYSTAGTSLPNNTSLSDSSVPDVAMSDTFQSSSQFNGLFRGVTYPALNSSSTTSGLPTGQIVGVVPFEFVASNSAPAGLTNMTSQLARGLFSSGTTALALFTGLNSDESFTIYATGRDFDSGTRLTTLAETGLGALATVKQYQPRKGGVVANTSGGALDAPPYAIWPAGSVNGVPYGTGNGGYNSGGDLANALGNTTSGSTCFVSYLGLSDAGTATTAGAHALTYNGVAYGVTAISEGQYTFWGYEHLYYRDGSPVKSLADLLANQIYNTDAPAPHYSAMNVSRQTDGGTVLQNY